MAETGRMPDPGIGMRIAPIQTRLTEGIRQDFCILPPVWAEPLAEAEHKPLAEKRDTKVMSTDKPDHQEAQVILHTGLEDPAGADITDMIPHNQITPAEAPECRAFAE